MTAPPPKKKEKKKGKLYIFQKNQKGAPFTKTFNKECTKPTTV